MRARQLTNFFLRFSLAANIAFLSKLYLRDRSNPQFKDFEKCSSKTFWKQIKSFSQLPQLHKRELESLRINELLAHPQYSCPSMTSFHNNGKNKGMFLNHKICQPPASLAVKFSNSTKFLSVLSFGDNLAFEKSFLKDFPSAKGFIFVPFQAIIQDNFPALLNNSFPLVRVEIEKDLMQENISIARAVRLAAQDLEKIDIFKLDSFDGSQQNSLLETVETLIDNGLFHNTNQILLTIRLETMKTSPIYRWYSVLQRLFYESHFAVFNAMQSGQCGRRINRCQYRVSLIRFPSNGSANIFAPLAGMATPDEEFQRWNQYLLRAVESSYTGQEIFLRIGSRPSYNLSIFKAPQTGILYVFLMPLSLQSSRFEAVDIEGSTNEIHIFDPTYQRSRREGSLFHHNYTLSTSSETKKAQGLSPESNLWDLRPLSAIIKGLGHSSSDLDTFVFDLEGMEWSVMQQLLDSYYVKFTVRQLVFRLRLWFGEEFENEQQKYSWFLRLELMDFVKDPARIIEAKGQDGHASILDVRFVRKPQSLQIRWIRRRRPGKLMERKI